MIPALHQKGARNVAQSNAPDRTGEKRTQFIEKFASSDFPAVIAGPSTFVDVTLPERTLTDGRILPERTIRTERAPVVSLRTNLDGEPFLALTDEDLNLRWMYPRANSVIGIDADADGVKISMQELIEKAVKGSREYFASITAGAGAAAVTGTDDLPL